MSKLNIGCGNQKYNKDEGWINIDISKEVNPDIILDIVKGLPYKDNSIDEIFAGCVIEQIDSNKDFIFVINEFYRVIKPNGTFWGYVPSTHPNTFHIDPVDKRFFTLQSFDYFDINKHHWNQFGKSYGFKPWKNLDIRMADNGIIHFKMTPAK